jgi:glucan 1,3-beta-glucosidase
MSIRPEAHPARTSAEPLRRAAALLMLAAALAALLAWALDRGRPVPLPEVGQARLPCISYAPFRRPGEAPDDPDLVIAPDRIEADLRRLATVTGCVRTYGLDHGLDAVPEIARRLGLRVLLGAWIDRDPEASATQLERALALTRSHSDVIDLLIVGNEVLLRRELTPEALAGLLARARRESEVPVAYADVWEFWLRHGAVLRGHVDLIAAHILPYWEDQPVALDQAVDHVAAIARRLDEAFAPLPVYVAETGWPAAGRQRGPAVPGRLEQARFVRGLLARQASEPLAFNLVEGFDQPWKRRLEGAMGGAWGLFDQEGQTRIPLTGPVVPDSQAWQVPLAAALGGLAGLGWAAWRIRGLWPTAALVLCGAGIAALLPLQWQHLVVWSRDPVELGLGSLTLLLALSCALAAAHRLARALAAAAPAHGPSQQPGRVSAYRGRLPIGQRLAALLLLGLLFALAVDALGLVFDGRYRPLPWPTLAAPALPLMALALLGERLAAGAREERVLAAVCAACAPLILALEGLANTQALLYAGLLLGLSVAVLLPHRSTGTC